MIKNGSGGGKTITGINFEHKVDLNTKINALPKYAIMDNEITFNGKPVAKLFKKWELYKNFLEPKNIDWEKYISKQLLPDQAIYTYSTNTLYIIEIKYQEVAGSVDEKLQTCDFKLKEYKKLFSSTTINIEYIYLLRGTFFKQSKYKDVLNYISSVNCKYFFDELPFQVIGLPTID